MQQKGNEEHTMETGSNHQETLDETQKDDVAQHIELPKDETTVETEPETDTRVNLIPEIPSALVEEQETEISSEASPEPVAQKDIEGNTPEVAPALSMAQTTERELEPARPSGQKPGKYTRWLRVLAAVLLLAIVGSGVVVYAQQRQSAQATPKSAQLSIPVPTPTLPLKISNWCMATGAPVPAQTGDLSLSGVVAVSANDAWAWGNTSKDDYFKDTARTLPFMEHWNGITWSVIPTADTTALLKNFKGQVDGDANEQVHLNNLTALSANNIWAVGEISVSQLSTSSSSFQPPQGIQTLTLGGFAGHTLIEHWDGSKWQIVNSPDGNPNDTFHGGNDHLSLISAVTPDDIWAAGGQSDNVAHNTILLDHWDGKSWKKVQLPSSLQHQGISSMQALASNDVWIFGTDFKLTSFKIVPITGTPISGGTPGWTTISAIGGNASISSFALHWNGTSWSNVSLPDVLSTHSLDATLVISPDNIWVTGITSTQSKATNFIEHWNGRRWSSVNGAEGVSNQSALDSIRASGLDVWIMGRTEKNKPLVEHWDGTTWSLVSPLSPTYGTVDDLTTAGQKAWAVVEEYKDGGNSNASLLIEPIASVIHLETNC